YGWADGLVPPIASAPQVSQPVLRGSEHAPRHRGTDRDGLGSAGRPADPRRRPVRLAMIERVVLVSPRGFCAGVIRAIAAVQRALELLHPPVYVRHAIVHNADVVRRLAAAGAVFVDDLDQVPRG